MSTLQAGERIRYEGDTIAFRFGARQDVRIALVGRDGRFVTPQAEGEWHSFPGLAAHGEEADVVIYLDETAVGQANDAYPVQMRIGASEWTLPEAKTALRSIILCHLYKKDGTSRLKASNEGHAFGIEAYARARNIEPPHGSRGTQGDRPYPRHSDEGPPSGRRGGGSGSGVIVAPNLVVTNAHVLEDATGFRIEAAQGSCQVLAVDTFHDLALIEGEFRGETLPVRCGDPVWLGEDVMAAGFPLSDLLGADLKVTGGHVSGLKGLRGDLARFQFSAPIGSGSSGGAVVDKQGRLVGVTAASLAHQELRHGGATSENVNFAVKACLVQELVASQGHELPANPGRTDLNPRELTNRLRRAVVQIEVAL